MASGGNEYKVVLVKNRDCVVIDIPKSRVRVMMYATCWKQFQREYDKRTVYVNKRGYPYIYMRSPVTGKSVERTLGPLIVQGKPGFEDWTDEPVRFHTKPNSNLVDMRLENLYYDSKSGGKRGGKRLPAYRRRREGSAGHLDNPENLGTGGVDHLRGDFPSISGREHIARTKAEDDPLWDYRPWRTWRSSFPQSSSKYRGEYETPPKRNRKTDEKLLTEAVNRLDGKVGGGSIFPGGDKTKWAREQGRRRRRKALVKGFKHYVQVSRVKTLMDGFRYVDRKLLDAEGWLLLKLRGKKE